jgi:hypothetical protein
MLNKLVSTYLQNIVLSFEALLSLTHKNVLMWKCYPLGVWAHKVTHLFQSLQSYFSVGKVSTSLINTIVKFNTKIEMALEKSTFLCN